MHCYFWTFANFLGRVRLGNPTSSTNPKQLHVVAVYVVIMKLIVCERNAETMFPLEKSILFVDLNL